MPFRADQRGQMWRIVDDATGSIARMPDKSIPGATVPVDGGGFPTEMQATANAMELNDTELKTGGLEDSPTDPGTVNDVE